MGFLVFFFGDIVFEGVLRCGGDGLSGLIFDPFGR